MFLHLGYRKVRVNRRKKGRNVIVPVKAAALYEIPSDTLMARIARMRGQETSGTRNPSVKKTAFGKKMFPAWREYSKKSKKINVDVGKRAKPEREARSE